MRMINWAQKKKVKKRRSRIFLEIVEKPKKMKITKTETISNKISYFIWSFENDKTIEMQLN